MKSQYWTRSPWPMGSKANHIATLGQSDVEVLVSIVGLAVSGVTAQRDYGGKGAPACGWHVQVSRNVELRETLKDDLADCVSVTADLADRARAEGRAVAGQIANQMKELVAIDILPLGEIRPRPNRLQAC